MDSVPALRNTYGADLVSLFVETRNIAATAGSDPIRITRSA